MKCTKTMLATGTLALLALATAYVVLPQLRALIVSAGPFLLFLLCPLSMLIMMISVNSHSEPAASPETEKGRVRSGDLHTKRGPAAEATVTRLGSDGSTFGCRGRSHEPSPSSASGRRAAAISRSKNRCPARDRLGFTRSGSTNE
ncbi:DUF2933 domain-containing protein [Caballeronia sp. Lep1P3]|uniref:DUF2933 domain-containing protein n=1 Tax=Caballeronia sp. Lep1P3 TaxID=2878150 RepID=UPI000A01BEC3|nr:DUF2933 domain-containing protein [Caballeronia sp. Lep1P3]